VRLGVAGKSADVFRILIRHSDQFRDLAGHSLDLAPDLVGQLADLAVVRLDRLHQELNSLGISQWSQLHFCRRTNTRG
jgi:hypothetical protein